MKIKYLLIIFLFSFAASVSAQDNTWRGLRIEKENRCSPYNRSRDYVYPQTVEHKIVESLENKIYSPYSGKYFKSIEETDIEHVVSLSEAHDSGLCAADEKIKIRFASDVLNLTLASPTVNRDEKSGFDASGWLPEKNRCWFANKVIEVKKAYNLTVDSKELVALEKVISECPSFEMVFFNNKDNLSQQNATLYTAGFIGRPKVKKSRSGICHKIKLNRDEAIANELKAFSSVSKAITNRKEAVSTYIKAQNVVGIVKAFTTKKDYVVYNSEVAHTKKNQAAVYVSKAYTEESKASITYSKALATGSKVYKQIINNDCFKHLKLKKTLMCKNTIKDLSKAKARLSDAWADKAKFYANLSKAYTNSSEDMSKIKTAMNKSHASLIKVNTIHNNSLEDMGKYCDIIN